MRILSATLVLALLPAGCGHAGGDRAPGDPRDLARSELVGRVVSEGAGAPETGAAVLWRLDRRPARTARAAGRRARAARTDAEGRFRLRAPGVPGYLSLWLEDDEAERLLVSGPYPLDEWFEPSGPYVVPARGVGLLVRVRDAAGRGVAGAEVGLVLAGEGAPVAALRTTDGDGFAAFEDLARADWWVDVAAEGYAPARVPASVSSRLVADVHVVLERAWSITGRLVDEAGEPVSGGWVRCIYANADLESVSELYTEVAADGGFSVAVPRYGRFRIDGGAPGYHPGRFSTAVPDGKLLVIRLEPR